jgi:hypothetical protein
MNAPKKFYGDQQTKILKVFGKCSKTLYDDLSKTILLLFYHI